MAAHPSAASPSRDATVREDAIAEVLAALRAGGTRIALQAPSEPARAATMRVLGERLRPAFRAALIPYPALPPAEVAAWVLGSLDAGLAGDPERRLLELAREGPGPVVLLLDDAEALPVATARRLDALLTEGEGALRLVAALDAHPRARRVLDALGSPEVLHRVTPPSGPAGVDREPAAEGRRAPPPDPFGPTPDPARDAPRAELAAVVEALRADLADGRPATSVTGPPGAGKTLVLRLLARALEPHAEVVALPYPALAPDEALAWLADLAGAPPGTDGEARLAAALETPRARGLVVLLDEAPALPEATRTRLLALAERHAPLQLALAGCVAEHAARSSWQPDPRLPRHRLGGTLTLEETRALLLGRLGDAADPLLAPASLRDLHEAARGSPALVLRRADEARRKAMRETEPGASEGGLPSGASGAGEPSAEGGGPADPAGPRATPSSGPGASAPAPERGNPSGPVPSLPSSREARAGPASSEAGSPVRPASARGGASAEPASAGPRGAGAVRPRAAAGPSARTPSSARGPSRRSRAAGLLALPLLLLSALLFAPRLLGPAEGGPLLPGFSKGPPARAPGPAPVPVRFAAPPDVRLLVDGRELSLGVSPEPVPLAPGTYRIEARWPDGRVARRDLRVAPLPEGAVLEIRAPGAAGAGAARLGGSVAPGAAASRRAPGPGGGS